MKYKNEEIIYIEYQDGKPHEVITDNGSYDFEPDCKEVELFMHYNSGSGCYDMKIPISTYIEEAKGKGCFWLHKDATITEIGNIKRITEPLEINGSKNPFDNSREVFDNIFCKYCDKYLDEDWCEHLTEDDDGNIIYQDGEMHD